MARKDSNKDIVQIEAPPSVVRAILDGGFLTLVAAAMTISQSA